MGKSLDVLAASLGLSPAQTADLKAAVAQQPQAATAFFKGSPDAANRNSQVALLTLVATRAVLGPDAVDLSPVDAAEIDTNWSETCWLQPAGAILPSSAHDVSAALTIIDFFQPRFSVRSGGHSPNPGWSSAGSPSTILVDLSRLNEVVVSTDGQTVGVGPGNRWGEVYDKLDPHGIAVLGGRISTVGVGGLIVGGGYNHFSAHYGLVADNVKNFEVVLGNGTIASANARQNPDLFWALKGGGPNLGIVTRYDLPPIPRDVWYEGLSFSNDQVPAVLDAFTAWQTASAGTQTNTTVGLIVGLVATTVLLLCAGYPAARPTAFAPFDVLTPAAVLFPPTNGSHMSLANLLAPSFMGPPARHDYRAASSKIDAQLYKDVYVFWRQQAEAVHATTGANMSFVLQPVPRSLVQQGIAHGGNALGLPLHDHQWWTTLIDWEDAADDDAVRSAAIAITDKWDQLSRQRGLSIPFVYMNDAGRDQDPLSSYGAANIARLKAVAGAYDPHHVFQNLQYDGFLLRKL